MHYEVLFFGSNPAEDNDDLWTGVDFETMVEAQKFFHNPTFPPHCPSEIVDYIVLAKATNDGMDVHYTHFESYRNPDFNPKHSEDFEDAWRSEARMQSGMAFGVQGWNDWEQSHHDDDIGGEFNDDVEREEF